MNIYIYIYITDFKNNTYIFEYSCSVKLMMIGIEGMVPRRGFRSSQPMERPGTAWTSFLVCVKVKTVRGKYLTYDMYTVQTPHICV